MAARAASTMALEYDEMNGGGVDLVLRPFQAVGELVRLDREERLEGHKEGGRQSVR